MVAVSAVSLVIAGGTHADSAKPDGDLSTMVAQSAGELIPLAKPACSLSFHRDRGPLSAVDREDRTGRVGDLRLAQADGTK